MCFWLEKRKNEIRYNQNNTSMRRLASCHLQLLARRMSTTRITCSFERSNIHSVECEQRMAEKSRTVSPLLLGDALPSSLLNMWEGILFLISNVSSFPDLSMYYRTCLNTAIVRETVVVEDGSREIQSCPVASRFLKKCAKEELWSVWFVYKWLIENPPSYRIYGSSFAPNRCSGMCHSFRCETQRELTP